MALIYLSHPFGGKTENRIQASKLAKWFTREWLREGKNYVIVNPLEELRELNGKLPENIILEKAAGRMLECDEVMFSPGWDKSFGCIYEHYVALNKGMKIHYLPDEITEIVA